MRIATGLIIIGLFTAWTSAARAQLQGPAILTTQSLEVKGNVCLDGGAFVSGLTDGLEHLTCDGTVDGGVAILPPGVYTEPDRFPGATYYFVDVRNGPGDLDTLLVLDRDGMALSRFVWPNAPHPDFHWSYDRSARLLSVRCRSAAIFNQETGPFARIGTDATVVVNFAPNLPDYLRTDLEIDDPSGSSIASTIINARFTGVTTLDRADRVHWIGGTTRLKSKVRLEPRNCLGLVCTTLETQGSVRLGTKRQPALTVILNRGDLSSGSWRTRGTLFSIGDVRLGGGGTLSYGRGLADCLPPAIDGWYPDPAASRVARARPVTKPAPPMTVDRAPGEARATPNPFRSETSITFALPLKSEVTVGIFDVVGREVFRAAPGRLDAGPQAIHWTGEDHEGRPVAPGIYFYRITAEGQTFRGTITRLR